MAYERDILAFTFVHSLHKMQINVRPIELIDDLDKDLTYTKLTLDGMMHDAKKNLVYLTAHFN